ncbi:MAG: response regulator [Bryobacteraceae bacterium]
MAHSLKASEGAPAKCRVWHVDDDDADHQLLVELLQADSSFSLHRARSGVEALQQLRHKQHLPNLVIVNWSFARMTCAEFIDQMKSEKRLAVIPIIVIASAISQDEVTLAYDSGAACVLGRGPDRASLARSLRVLKDFWTLVLLPFCPHPMPKAETIGIEPRTTRKTSKLTAEQRSAAAKKAVQARWAKAKPHSSAP